MIAYLNIGTNLGDKSRNIEDAISSIENEFHAKALRSKIIESEPWGYNSRNSYLNIGIAIECGVSPTILLSKLHNIEKNLGSASHRNADGSYADRLIDIDIMAIDNLHIDLPNLKVPHPHLYDRPFFSLPYKELQSLVASRK